MRVDKFFFEEFSSYALYSAFRGIGSFVDGQKPSSRKVLCVSKKLSEKTKVASLAARVVDTMEYLHGAVNLEGVITNMAQKFTGTNNINLLQPNGDFGSVCIQRPGSPRYIYVTKSSIYSHIIMPEDEGVLIEQEFEGTKIEPKFYVPIIPMILINGSIGIGTGFSQKILPRNPEEIINKIERRLKGEGAKRQDPIIFLPYFNGFTGRIKKTDEKSFEIHGVFERVHTTKLMITELPIGYDLEKYTGILSKLEEDKVIVDYTDLSEPKENKFLFEVRVTREFTKHDDEWIMSTLKLISKVTENYTCIGINNEIVEFDSVDRILDWYMDVRLDYYQKRKDFLINQVKEQLMIAGSKFYFVKLILEGDIKVFKQPKESIVGQIRKSKKFPFYEIDGNFDYLLRMPIHSFSKETLEELKKDIEAKKSRLKELETITLEDMWLADLKTLKKEISKC